MISDPPSPPGGIALIVGAGGIIGNNLARHLIKQDWTVYGLARQAMRHHWKGRCGKPVRSGPESPSARVSFEANLERLASPWHTDLDLGREIECVTDMSKSRKAGFLAYQDTRDSFLGLFAHAETSHSLNGPALFPP